MNLKNRIIAFAAATAIIVPAAALGAFSIKKDSSPKSVVRVVGVLPVGGKVDCSVERTADAKLPEVTIEEAGETLKVNVALGALKTGLAPRDKHFRQRMKKLEASLSVKKSDVKDKKGKSTIPGSLSLNGVTRPVQVTFNAEDKGNHLKVTGSIKDPNASKPEGDEKITGINHYDFNIGKAFCEMGVCVKPNLDITAELYVNKD